MSFITGVVVLLSTVTCVFVGHSSASACGICEKNLTCHLFKNTGKAKCLPRITCHAGKWSLSFVMCIYMYMHVTTTLGENPL